MRLPYGRISANRILAAAKAPTGKSKAGMDAGVNNFPGFALQNPQPKNSMDAVFRQRKG
jgi:hypothetical protein